MPNSVSSFTTGSVVVTFVVVVTTVVSVSIVVVSFAASLVSVDVIVSLVLVVSEVVGSSLLGVSSCTSDTIELSSVVGVLLFDGDKAPIISTTPHKATALISLAFVDIFDLNIKNCYGYWEKGNR